MEQMPLYMAKTNTCYLSSPQTKLALIVVLVSFWNIFAPVPHCSGISISYITWAYVLGNGLPSLKNVPSINIKNSFNTPQTANSKICFMAVRSLVLTTELKYIYRNIFYYQFNVSSEVVTVKRKKKKTPVKMSNKRGLCSNPIQNYYKDRAEKGSLWPMKASQKDRPTEEIKTVPNILKWTGRI